jgi:hypothetical protein
LKDEQRFEHGNGAGRKRGLQLLIRTDDDLPRAAGPLMLYRILTWPKVRRVPAAQGGSQPQFEAQGGKSIDLKEIAGG